MRVFLWFALFCKRMESRFFFFLREVQAGDLMYWHILTKYPLLLFAYYVLRFICLLLYLGS